MDEKLLQDISIELKKYMNMYNQFVHDNNPCFSRASFRILSKLYEVKKSRMADISSCLNMKNGNVTIVVDELIEKELVFRESCADDRRIVYVSISTKGIELFESFNKIQNDFTVKVFKNLEDKEVRELLRLLKKGSQDISCDN